MNFLRLAVSIGILFFFTSVFAETTPLSPQDEAAAFRAAGFSWQDRRWRLCDDPTSAYVPGAIQEVRDVNGDGLPEMVITEGGTYCYGNTGSGYSLVSKQPGGDWMRVTFGTGILRFLETTGVDGWQDIEIGGPGFCFPVQRWNGKGYELNRYHYDGKTCNP